MVSASAVGAATRPAPPRLRIPPVVVLLALLSLVARATSRAIGLPEVVQAPAIYTALVLVCTVEDLVVLRLALRGAPLLLALVVASLISRLAFFALARLDVYLLAWPVSFVGWLEDMHVICRWHRLRARSRSRR